MQMLAHEEKMAIEGKPPSKRSRRIDPANQSFGSSNYTEM
jgi:hypothetical protein